ncbi:alkaline phosphatase family protein [Natrinema ejinorense]|uniref:Nucleotide pyrophosphatase n=1 Tax=Natrinema ejinorense TaxID=373386 RepID=A0A2A5QVU2_9EURY|nr:nucleotide pyrophosphatase/phosphodiesterase family protein [Natrinema ejinorense]PCR90869.1 nucleotide pyrophosphatase [Natrinema ejinorense]
MRPELESQLRRRLFEEGYLFPDYERYCFANIPGTALSVLETDGMPVPRRQLPDDVLRGLGGEYDRVLVVLVDGFGLRFWNRHDHPLLERLETDGTVSPLTSIYPSETAAAVTTFHTGRLPASHGVLGWDVYDPADDASYEAFTVDAKAGAESIDHGLQDVFEGDPIYPDLKAAGIDCRHVVPFPETYDGAAVHSYGGGDAAARKHGLEGFESALWAAFDAATDPSYLFAYLPQIDTAAHAAGTDSKAYRDTVTETLDTLERALTGLVADETTAAGDTLVLVTADHGHVDTDPDRTVDLETYDTVMATLERYADGEPVRYAGSPRNVHLHLRTDDEGPGAGADVLETVRSALADLDARVFTADEARDRDLFGDCEESETFRRRLGDLVVCHREQAVWYGSDPATLELIGMHGGLHPDEMLVPFGAIDLELL